MDLGLAAELGRHRLDGQARGLLAAVAAALAHALVDPHLLGRLGQLAALAQAPLLGGALVVVDQHGHPGHGRQLGLHVLQLVAVAHGGGRGQGHAAVALGLGRGDHHPGDALELEQPGDGGDVQLALGVLAAGHGHGGVVEQAVGHVDPGGHGRPDGQRPRVMESAVAQVLDEVRVVGERSEADPLRPLASHLRHANELPAAPALVQRDHGVAADPHAHQLVRLGAGGGVVRAARAEVGRAHRQRGAGRGPGLGVLLLQQRQPRERLLGHQPRSRARPRSRATSSAPVVVRTGPPITCGRRRASRTAPP